MFKAMTSRNESQRERPMHAMQELRELCTEVLQGRATVVFTRVQCNSVSNMERGGGSNIHMRLSGTLKDQLPNDSNQLQNILLGVLQERLPLLSPRIVESSLDGMQEIQVYVPSRSELHRRGIAKASGSGLIGIVKLATNVLAISVFAYVLVLATLHKLK